MLTVWGIVMVVLGLIGWGGQVLSWVAPDTAVRWGLRESEDSVEPVFDADVQGEAAWDAVTLWTLAVAGGLLIADIDVWAHFGVVGGAFYVYFGGRGVLSRVAMLRRGFRVGSAANVRSAFLFLSVWMVAGAITIGLALSDLAGG